MTTYTVLTLQKIEEDPKFLENVTSKGFVIHYHTLMHGYACNHMNERLQSWIYGDFFSENECKVIEINAEEFENCKKLTPWTIHAYPCLQTFVDGELVHSYIGSNASQFVLELKDKLDDYFNLNGSAER
jgi:hypothetical protein